MNRTSTRHFMLLGTILLLLSIPRAASCLLSDRGAPAVYGDPAAVAVYSDRLAGATGQERIRTLIERGEAYLTLGHYQNAGTDFNDALDAAREAGEPLFEAMAMQCLGYLRFLEGSPDLAEPLLRDALEKAKALDRPILAGVGANRLGNVLLGQERREEALALYREALAQADQGDDPGLKTAVLINLARVSPDDRRAAERLYAAREASRAVACADERARLLLEVAAETQDRKTEDRRVAFVYEVLTEALALATKIGSDRLVSQAAGRLGALYERRGRLDEARALTEQALAKTQRLRAHDLSLQWEWQLGRIWKASGQKEKAIAAYRRAVSHIQAVRQDIPIRLHGGRSSFRQTLSPIYFGLADLLLEQSAQEDEDAARQRLLGEARDTVELIKRSEIRDYFNDPCVDALGQQVQSLSPGAAVLYPIVFPDRLELLVDVDGRLYRETAETTGEEIEKTVAALASDLRHPRTDSSHEEPSRQVFQWLVRPVLPILEESRIDTLVYVPDGVFRLLPIVALWDGERFLVERFAVATVPGLTLLAPNPLPRQDMAALLAGVSEPGPVVYELPANMWNALSETEPNDQNRRVRGIATVLENPESQPEKGGQDAEDRESGAERVKEALALPGVENEIRRLSENLEAKVLLNQEFSLESFSRDFQDNDYRVVHIASHGYFGGTPEQSFVMTYDRLLNMNELEDLVKSKRLSVRPVELIALSACQTAEGDDRSPLGLAGVALKSGARSGLGSLWPVSDDAAQELLPAFYEHLKDPGNTKAQALRKSQLDLMKDARFRHPFFWSPFILVGNWL